MAIHFVSTSILRSEDGVEFSKEISIESEDVKAARANASSRSDKSLYDQLEERKKVKDDEYETNGKLMRSVKGIDEEDVDFFQDLAETEAKARAATQNRDDEALQKFRVAQSQSTNSDLGSEATKSLFLNKDTKEKNSDASQKHESTSKTIIVRKKRKLNEELRQGEKGSDVLCKNAKESNEKDDSNPKSKSGKNTIEKSVISDMLGSYGSSSDDED